MSDVCSYTCNYVAENYVIYMDNLSNKKLLLAYHAGAPKFTQCPLVCNKMLTQRFHF
jgi:hypothetical protein